MAPHKKLSDNNQEIESYLNQIKQLQKKNQKLKKEVERIKELQTVESFFITENKTDIVCKVSTKGNIDYINPASENILGYKPSDMIGKNAFRFIHTDDLQQALVGFNDVLNKNKPRRVEARLMCSDGTYLWNEIRGHAFFHNKKIVGLILEARDINQRKHVEERLRRSEEKYKRMIDDISDYVYIHDTDGYFLESNHAFKETFKHFEHIFSHLNVKDIIPEKYRKGFKDYLREVFDEGHAHGLMKVIGSDKKEHIFEYNNRLFYDENDKPYVLGIARDITERVEHSIEKKKYVEQLKEMALHDSLTGLPNRKYFYDRLKYVMDHANRTTKPGALLFVDLDQFKNINDTYGHEVGDLLLKYVADRLHDSIRKDDLVARLAGDEFIILLSDINNLKAPEIVAEKVINVLSKEFLINDISIKTSVSIGICYYPPEGEDLEQLIKKSDTAMYEAKRSGKNTYKIFNDL